MGKYDKFGQLHQLDGKSGGQTSKWQLFSSGLEIRAEDYLKYLKLYINIFDSIYISQSLQSSFFHKPKTTCDLIAGDWA